MTLGSHQTTIGKSQTHLTPKRFIDALGPFDLDPCAADPRPWDCAAWNYTVADDGLALPWFGLVWLNPPFHRYQVARWTEKMAVHGDGIVLVHARVETEWFQPIWLCAKRILFLADRVRFCLSDGTQQPANSGAPVALAAFGDEAADRLERAGLPGFMATGWVESLRDSDSRPAGSRPERARCEARQSGGAKGGASPTPTPSQDNPNA